MILVTWFLFKFLFSIYILLETKDGFKFFKFSPIGDATFGVKTVIKTQFKKKLLIFTIF